MSAGEELKYKMAFSFIKGMNRLYAAEIIDRLGGAEPFFRFDTAELSSIFGTQAPQFRSEIRDAAIERAEKEIEWLDGHPLITPVFLTEDNYPGRLFECEDAPLMIYVAGNPDVLRSERTVSMVGTRNATVYGEMFIKKFVSDLAEIAPGTVIISGLAYGIDIMSHCAALENNLPTVAVVAHGLSTVYPAAHRSYVRQIIDSGGAIVTEYPHDARIHRVNFLARNRIIAGLSDCVVVVESDVRGGAMATASDGNDYNRDVFAVPGRVNDRYSSGCNRLIQQNKACILTSAEELAGIMKWKSARPAEGEQRTLGIFLPPERQKIVDYILEKEMRAENYSLTRMAVDLGMTLNSLNEITAEMEFDNQIVKTPGGKLKVTIQ